MPNTTKHSRLLSLVLRHKPETIGLTLDGSGWADIDALLDSLPRAGVTMTRDHLLELVDNNDKKRFAISRDGRFIRARQGHSVDVDLGLEPKEPPTILHHGTAEKSLASILKSGLRRGQRHHVHLHTDRDLAETVGRRHGKPVLLEVSALAMWQDGHLFFVTDNGVWLTEAVPVAYLQVV